MDMGGIQGWRAMAACQAQLELFADPALEREALNVCRGCVVRPECLNDALACGDLDLPRAGLSRAELQVAAGRSIGPQPIRMLEHGTAAAARVHHTRREPLCQICQDALLVTS